MIFFEGIPFCGRRKKETDILTHSFRVVSGDFQKIVPFPCHLPMEFVFVFGDIFIFRHSKLLLVKHNFGKISYFSQPFSQQCRGICHSIYVQFQLSSEDDVVKMHILRMCRA